MIRHFRLPDFFRFIFLTLFGRGQGDAVNIGPERIYLSPPHLSGEEGTYLQDALKSNWIGPVGPHVRRFEREMASLLQVEKAVSVNSGTAALHLILRALNIGPGDIVLCSSFTFVASVNPVLYVGAQPVLIDSETTSWNLDPDLLEKAIEDLKNKGPKPKALILVHLYGQSANLERIQAICERENILLIEDAAEALGATYGNRCPGSFGVAGFLSFNGNKIITTSGGGMIVTNDPELATQTRYLAAQAKDPGTSYEHSVMGYNYSFSNVLAAIGRAQLKALPGRVIQKREVFRKYQKGLGDLPGITFMPEASWGKSTRWLSCLLLNPREGTPEPMEVIEELEKFNIESRPLWKPMHQQIIYRETPFYGNGVADDLYDRGLCLPSPSDLSPTQQDHIIEIIRRLF
ncbi:MAG: aminotransferase class I/II-fold pyridoxal phosphate-dependent enzyme [Opitutales bacterium]|nr:aminotransferase class I/II-fold pyridoxal phosphate-dependent enzyme [Opitutales bacterium]